MDNSANTLNKLTSTDTYRALAARLQRVFHSLTTFSGLGPLSARSVVALLFLIYLLLGPIQEGADIVSAALTYALFVVILVAAVVMLVHGSLLRRALSLSILPPEHPSLSGEPTRIVIALNRASILPFFFLDITLDFEHPGATRAVTRVSGLSREERRSHVDVTFPHRGSWDIRGARCSLRDITGLTRYSWEIFQQTAVTVAPPPAHDTNLPVLSSTQRPGEMMVDLFNRQGDPFDIKAYHPSDGVKKIVWKTFAKRGELLSRHPEAAMTPEGFVVMFVIAGKEGDRLCAQTIAYAESLARLNLEIIASCEGISGRTPAHSPEDLKSLLIDCVWDSSPSPHLQSDASSLIDYCRQLTPGITVSKLLLFTSAERISNGEDAKEIYALGEWLSNQGIAPVFSLTQTSRFSVPQPRFKLNKLSRFIVRPLDSTGAEISHQSYHAFLASCLRNQWEVYA